MPIGARGSVVGFYRNIEDEAFVTFDDGQSLSVPDAILRALPQPPDRS